jgi:hypothetical protein
MRRRLRLVLVASELLRVVTRIVPPFTYVADGVYVVATKG